MEPSVEQTISPAEKLPTAEARVESPLDTAIEAGAVDQVVERTNAEAITEVKSYLKDVSPETTALAEATEKELLAKYGEAKEEIAKVTKTEDQAAIEEAEADLTKMHAEAGIGTPSVDTTRVKVMPTISIGEVPSKVAKRMTPEDVAAVTARKIIPIGGASTAEAPVLHELPKPRSAEEQKKEVEMPKVMVAPETEAEVAEGGEAEGSEMSEEEAGSPEVTKKKQEAADQGKQIESAEAELGSLFADSDGMFAKGDVEGLERLSEESQGTILEEEAKLVAWKSKFPNPEMYSKETAVGFALWSRALDVARARRDRVEAQAELLGLKKQQEGETDPAKKAEIGTNVDATSGEIVALDAEISATMQDMDRIKKEYQAAKEKKPEGETKEREEKEKPYEAQAPDIAGSINRGADKLIDLAAGALQRWTDFAMTGKSTTLDDISRWLDRRDEKRKKKTAAEIQKRKDEEKRLELVNSQESQDEYQKKLAETLERRKQEDADLEALKAETEAKKKQEMLTGDEKKKKEEEAKKAKEQEEQEAKDEQAPIAKAA